ncbi:DUF1963 domain-containing protein [Umezawaea sp. Da 62-37]|uniref:DUF1963 domain-containing protein n=1 Tax=Umezawaea sp. Da 62-37 TaxID=3075927 RepID=UPI0028F72A34|nr:DUF1963 domain-containing protein [Umezawaea sp. Da 62-37]WNV83285.1 DUF1963 domain-containing protein [Umezawaea sp. Da 62-37]
MNQLEAFQAAAREQDLPHDVVDWCLGQARPCLDLRRSGTGPAVGYFGGRPALPAGIAWPADTALHLASIDLAAIPRGALDLGLPDDGTLLFFAQADNLCRHGKVIHVPAGTPVTEAEPPDAGQAVYDRFPLYGHPRLCIPESYDNGELDEEVLNALDDIVWDLEYDTEHDDDKVVTLGGYGYANTGGLGIPVRSFTTEALLAEFFLSEDEVGEDFETDLATVFYVIARDDLSAHRFDRLTVATDFHG